jgi:hypothetical protein
LGDSFVVAYGDLRAIVLDRPTQIEGCCIPEDVSLDDLPTHNDHRLLGGVIPVWPRAEEEDDNEAGSWIEPSLQLDAGRRR